MRKLLAVMLTLVLTLCATIGIADEALFTPGTYEGVGNGFGGELKVAVVVDENSIRSVEVLENGETVGVADAALTKIPAQIVESQSLAVDAISGCTFASNAVIEAVTDALSKACDDVSVLMVAVEKKAVDAEMEELSADIVIVGAGGAGLAAATEAIEAGCSVIIIEKMPSIGGNTIRAGSALNAADPENQKNIEMTDLERQTIVDILAAEPHDDYMAAWQNTLKTEFDEYVASGATYLFDSPSLHKLQTYMGGDYVGNPELIDIFAANALNGVEFLSKYGAVWQNTINAAMGATWKRSHNPELIYGSKGMTFIKPLEDFLAASNCETYVDHKAEHLVMADGRVVGVTGTTSDGQPFMAKANKAVILTTGGFGANVEMRVAYNKHWANLGDNIGTSNQPGTTGDGIIMALEVGANLVGMEWIQLTPWGSNAVPQAAIDNQIFVNQEGLRFINEDNRRDVMAAEALKQTDSLFYLIYDGNIVIDGSTLTGNDIDAKVGKDLPGGEKIFKADTLEELCEQIGVPYANLAMTIEKFNASVDGEKDELGRKLYDKKLGVAPFYASLTAPVVHHTMGGIEINACAQVIDTDGNVIEGLYAAGETTGGIHGSNRLGGNAIADIFVFGRIAGQNAAQE